MAKYEFIKDYNASGAGVRFDLYPHINRIFKKGELVDRVNIDSKGFANGVISPNSFAVRSNTGGSLPNGVPFTGIGILEIKDTSVLKSIDMNGGENKEGGGLPQTGSWWTAMSPMNQGIIVAGVLIGGYYALKYFKWVK